MRQMYHVPVHRHLDRAVKSPYSAGFMSGIQFMESVLSVSGLPFDDIRSLVAGLPAANKDVASIADERSGVLTTCFGFGSFEAGLCNWLSAWSGKSPSVTRPMVALFAGTHAVSGDFPDWPGESTLHQVTRMAAGGAPVNQVCAVQDVGLKVFDLALQYPVGDITTDHALDEKGSAATIGFGMEAIAGGVDLLGLAAFGKGAEVCNAVVAHVLSGMPIEAFTGFHASGFNRKLTALAEDTVALHAPGLKDPLEILRRLGGREHSALLGGILAARVNHVPVVLDGITAIVVGALLQRLAPSALDHCRFASNGAPGGFREMQESLGIEAILPGFSASNDGTSAGHAMGLVKSVAAVHGQSVAEYSDG